MSKLRELLTLLITGSELPQRFQDHALKGAWKDYRDAHIEPDWLLIYCVVENELRLVRTGTHADLFG